MCKEISDITVTKVVYIVINTYLMETLKGNQWNNDIQSLYLKSKFLVKSAVFKCRKESDNIHVHTEMMY